MRSRKKKNEIYYNEEGLQTVNYKSIQLEGYRIDMLYDSVDRL
ncbi:MAG: hypothetical protein ACK5MI_02815 [Mangrovibacterium sp.]